MHIEKNDSGPASLRFSTFEGQRLPRWLRGPAKYEGGAIVLDIRRSDEYDPIDPQEDMSGLLFDLTAVASDEDAIRFVRRYGVLKTPRDTWDVWNDTVLRLRVVLDLYKGFRSGSLGRRAAVANLRASGLGSTSRPRDVLRDAALFLELAVNEGLRGTEERIRQTLEDPARRGLPSFESTSQPRDLAGLAFVQLKAIIVERTPVKECAECKRFFEVDDARRRFHSTPCQNRARWRKWKKAHPKGRRLT